MHVLMVWGPTPPSKVKTRDTGSPEPRVIVSKRGLNVGLGRMEDVKVSWNKLSSTLSVRPYQDPTRLRSLFRFRHPSSFQGSLVCGLQPQRISTIDNNGP